MGDTDLGDLEGGFQPRGLKVGHGLSIRPVVELTGEGAPMELPVPPATHPAFRRGRRSSKVALE